MLFLMVLTILVLADRMDIEDGAGSAPPMVVFAMIELILEIAILGSSCKFL